MCKRTNKLDREYISGKIDVGRYVSGLQQIAIDRRNATLRSVNAKRLADELLLAMLPVSFVAMLLLVAYVLLTK